MRFLSLRAVIGALSALLVAIVASVTLSLALTSSLEALRAMGTRHAAALLDVADTAAVSLFAGTTDQVMSFVNFTAGDNWTFPSERNAGANRTLDALLTTTRLAVSRGFPVMTTFNLFLADNTYILFDCSRTDLRPTGEALIVLTQASPFSTDFPRQVATETRHLYSYRTLRTRPLPGHVPEAVTPFRNTSIWTTLDVGSFGSYAPAIYPPSATPRDNGGFMIFIPLGAPLYTQDAAARTQTHVFGYAVVTMELGDIAAFLARATSTPNTAAFALDRGGYLLGTSEPTPFATARPLASVVPPGCASTEEADPAGSNHVLACRAHASEYPSAALNALAAQRPELLRPPSGAAIVERIGDLGGEPYYVDTKRVRIAFRGLEVYLLLLMPEADVIGDVITSRNVAIGVTCGLVVLAAAVNVAVVWLLLAPLGGIAERMVRAANLEDDDDDATVSAMAEVAELQEAYYAMNAELNRIRSYVPQSVLVARGELEPSGSASEGDDDFGVSVIGSPMPRQLTFEEPAGRSSTSDVRSVQSRKSKKNKNSSVARDDERSDTRSMRHVVSRRRSGSVCIAPLTPGADVRNRNVSIVAANVRGLHTVLIKETSERPERLTDEIAAAARMIEAAVTQRHGVLTFHGDRFLATFNTARPCAGHASKAALAAVMCTSAKTFVGSGSLRITAGVATGPCLVGSVGSATMKTLSTVGPAVSNAALLEQLTREHDGVSVLATHRTCVDAATAVRVRYVDLANIPAGKAGDKRVTAIAAISAMHGDSGIGDGADGGAPQDAEWMYVLEGAGSGADAAFNEAFEALQRDDPARALEVLANALDSASEADSGPAASPPPRLAAIAERLRAQMSAGSAPSVRDALERSSVQCQKSATAAVE